LYQAIIGKLTQLIVFEYYLYAFLQSGDTKPAIFSDLKLKPVGLLEVKLVEARDLKNKDLVGKSDPFAVLYIRPLSAKTKKSKTIVSELRSSGQLRETISLLLSCCRIMI
jgi:hypothetical protein